MTRDEENKIITKALSGDINAFEELVLANQSKVYSLALRMVGNEEDAKDMSQEAFIRAFNSLGGFRGDSKFSVWLYRLTTNICIDFIRSCGKRQALSLTHETDESNGAEMEIPDERFSPELGLERQEIRLAVHRGLETLTPEYRSILLLREINGLTYCEIGHALGLEEGTVKSRLFRARRKLSEFLLKDGNFTNGFASQEERGSEDV